MTSPNNSEIKSGLTFRFKGIEVVVDRKDGDRLWWVHRNFPGRRRRHGKMSERNILAAIKDNPTVRLGPIPGIPGHGAAKGMQPHRPTKQEIVRANRRSVRELNRQYVYMR